MGLIKATLSAAGGTLADQWIDAIVPNNMTNTTIMTSGVMANADDRRNQNKKGSKGVITDGSLIHVGENQMMLLVDGGKIVDYCAEPGYYKLDSQNAPSLLSGDFGGALSDAFNRFKFGGTSPYIQEVIYINTQELQVPFGTSNPINYFDNFYNAELHLRAHGFYSVKVVNPILFYSEVASKSSAYMTVDELKTIFLSEFLTAFQTTIGKMSQAGERVSYMSSKSEEIASYMSDVLDESWEQNRGMKVVSVGISSISYDDESKRLINMRNEGAMLSDPTVRDGYVQGSVARGMEAAGSNPSGAGSGFMGINMATSAGGNFVAAATGANAAASAAQAQQAAQVPPTTPAATAASWKCPKCSFENTGGKFCAECGTARPQSKHCTECGNQVPDGAKFCNDCGAKL